MSKLIVSPGDDTNIKDTTQEVLNKKYRDEIGHKAVVQRESLENDRTDALKEVLKDIGKDAITVGMIPKGMEYVGSAAVHIYRAPSLGHVAYFNQIALATCPEALAGPAVSDLRGSMLQFYNHNRQKKRSGF